MAELRFLTNRPTEPRSPRPYFDTNWSASSSFFGAILDIILHLKLRSHLLERAPLLGGNADESEGPPQRPEIYFANIRRVPTPFPFPSRDDNKKEQELQIGLPTDVKHVAHIGWEGPCANAPSWMSEFDTTPQLTLQPVNPLGDTTDPSIESASEDMEQTGVGSQDSLLRNLKDTQDSPRVLLSTGFGSPQRSPSKRGSSATKHPRRHHKSGASADAPSQESTRPTRHSRRNQNLGLGVESPSHDAAMVSKQSRRRKSKGLSGGGSTRTLRSKGQNPSDDASSLTEHGSGSEHGQGLKKTQESSQHSYRSD